MGKLIKGVNDLYTWCMENGEFGQQLISEWTGICNEGKYYAMTDVTKSSDKRMLWKCSDGHTWYAKIVQRTYSKTMCPYSVSARNIKEKNNLLNWCYNNGDFGNVLKLEWTGTCNDGNHYEITDASIYSTKMMLWKCSKGHEWYAKIIQRTYKKTKCPYCSCVTDENCLYNWCNNNIDGLRLISEWTGICEDGNHYEMNEVAKASKKKMLWKCSKGHEWYALISNRTNGKNWCPECFYKRLSIIKSNSVTKENNLYTYCLDNGDFGEQLIQEWTGICKDEHTYKMTEVSRGTNKVMFWKCSKGHKWYSRVITRTQYKTNCPYCNNKSTSYPEQFLYRALKQIYPQTISRGRFQGIEYDITIPEEKTCIEYSGAIWHSDKVERDQLKADLCKQYNVRFIQIYANSTGIDEVLDQDFIVYTVNDNKDLHNEQLVQILNHILKSFNHSIDEIDIEKAQTEAFNFMHDIDKDKE